MALSVIGRIQLAWLALTQGQKSVRVATTWEMGQPQSLPVDYETLAGSGYSRNEIVFACIAYIAESAAEAKWTVMLGNEQGAGPAHPLVRLLAKPNPTMNLTDVIQATLVMLNIVGDAYWEKERARNKRDVVALWPMRPDRVKVIPGEHGIAGYRYELPDGSFRVDYEARDVVHFRYYNPLNEYFGLSPLQVCARAVDADNERSDFTRAFFTNAAVPYGLLTTKQKLIEAEAKRIATRWQEQYGGSENWHRVAVLDSDITYQRLGLTQQEMAFPDLTALTESRICMVFRVPPILIGSKFGLERATYANMQEARAGFWQDRMSGILAALTDTMNMSLSPDYNGTTITLDLSEVKALQENRDAMWARANMGVAGSWATVNEGRAEAGLDAIPTGDVFLRPMTTVEVPVEEEAEEQTPPEEEMLVEEETVPEEETPPEKSSLISSLEVLESAILGDRQRIISAMAQRLDREIMTGVKATDNEWITEEGGIERERQRGLKKLYEGLESKARPTPAVMARRIDQVARSHELQFARAARTLFREDKAAVLAHMGGGKGARKADWHSAFLIAVQAALDGRKVDWQKKFMPLFALVLAEQGDALEAMFGISFDVHNPKVQEFLKDYSFKFADKLQDVSKDKIRDLIARAQEEGWAIPELQRNLKELYDGWDDLRAEQISRTETIRSSNYGARELYRQAGVERLRWVTATDDRVCEWCADMDGRVIGIEENFFDQGDPFPIGSPEDEGGQRIMNLDYEAVGAPPLHVDCILPGNIVAAPEKILSATKALYVGRCIEVGLANGSNITVTENHPILGRHGWIAAKDVRQGDDVFCATDLNGIMATLNPDDYYAPAAIEQIFDAVMKRRKVISARVPTSAEDFHGDGRFIQGDVEIVYEHGLLLSDNQTVGAKHIGQDCFRSRTSDLPSFFSFGNPYAFLDCNLTAPASVMSMGSQRAALFGRGPCHTDVHGFGNIAGNNARLKNAPAQDTATDASFPREFLLRFAGKVATQQVVNVRDFDYSGHVYNLQVDQYGLYTCNGTVVKNCRCVLIADVD